MVKKSLEQRIALIKTAKFSKLLLALQTIHHPVRDLQNCFDESGNLDGKFKEISNVADVVRFGPRLVCRV